MAGVKGRVALVLTAVALCAPLKWMAMQLPWEDRRNGRDELGLALDAYGGITQLPSPRGGTGFFRMEKMGSRWTFIDPLGNAFLLMGVDVVSPESSNNELGVNYRTLAAAKYGDVSLNWATAQLQRLRSWGFNTIGPYSSIYTWPVHKEGNWPGDHYLAEKMPFLNYNLRPSYYGMMNSAGYLSEPLKNFVFGINQTYDTSWIPSVGEADYFDRKLYSYLDGLLGEIPGKPADPQMVDLNNPANPNRSWFVGILTDETDQTFSFNAGADFRSSPSGQNHAHGGYRAAVVSPMLTAGMCCGQVTGRSVYPDTKVYNKLAWRDYLMGLAKYQVNGVAEIAKLNAAWGSTYTTWNSAGEVVTGERLGTGDGSSLTFLATLTRTAVAKFSTQVLVDGVPVAGDLCGATLSATSQKCNNTVTVGNLWGPRVTGTLAYATGALSVTFAAGSAPAAGAAITVNYVANGWGIGSGLLDEDGRHTSWMGSNSVCLVTSAACATATANSNFAADADGFLYEMAKNYFTTGKAHTLAHFNKLVPGWTPIYIGLDTMASWGVPARAPVLKAAGEVLDIMATSGAPLSQDKLDFFYQHAGDKPMVNVSLFPANPDSAMWRYPNDTGAIGAFTQAGRAQNYRNSLLATGNPAGFMNSVYSATGTHPYVGIMLWKFLDTRSQQSNWGLVTLSDNAYDGREAIYTDESFSHSATCSAPLQAKKYCGGEEHTYGDFIGPATSANAAARLLFCRHLGGCGAGNREGVR